MFSNSTSHQLYDCRLLDPHNHHCFFRDWIAIATMPLLLHHTVCSRRVSQTRWAFEFGAYYKLQVKLWDEVHSCQFYLVRTCTDVSYMAIATSRAGFMDTRSVMLAMETVDWQAPEKVDRSFPRIQISLWASSLEYFDKNLTLNADKKRSSQTDLIFIFCILHSSSISSRHKKGQQVWQFSWPVHPWTPL